jgi:hypothetical protein
MEKGILDKIPAVLQQARKRAGYDLLTIGKNAVYGCFSGNRFRKAGFNICFFNNIPAR